MTELNLIDDLHKNSERQGPGSENETLKALGFLNLPAHQKLKANLKTAQAPAVLYGKGNKKTLEERSIQLSVQGMRQKLP